MIIAFASNVTHVAHLIRRTADEAKRMGGNLTRVTLRGHGDKQCSQKRNHHKKW